MRHIKIIIFILGVLSRPSLGNDLFADRISINGELPIDIEGNLIGSSVQALEPDHRPYTIFYRDNPKIDRSRWYTWEAQEDGWFKASVQAPQGLNFAIYKGISLNTLRSVAKGWPAPTVHSTSLPFHSVAGETYHFSIAGSSIENSSSFIFSLSKSSPPSPNDDFVDRIDLGEAIDRTIIAGNYGASAEVGEPHHDNERAISSVWWKFTPSVDRVYEIDFVNPNAYNSFANPYARFAIYTGNSLGNLAEVTNSLGCGCQRVSPSFVKLSAKAGTTYSLAVDQSTFLGRKQGRFAIRIRETEDDTSTSSFHPPPINDDIANAIDLGNSRSAIISSTFLGATKEVGEQLRVDLLFDTLVLDHTTWWKWTPPASGEYAISPFGRGPNSYLFVYLKEESGRLKRIALINGEFELFEAAEGTTYWFAVGTTQTNSNSLFTFALTQPEQHSNISYATAISLGKISQLAIEGQNITNPEKEKWWTWHQSESGLFRIHKVIDGSLTWSFLYQKHGNHLEPVFNVPFQDFLKLEGGTEYVISISRPSLSKRGSGLFRYISEKVHTSPNDLFEHAIDLGKSKGAISHTTAFQANNHLEPSEPPSNHSKTLWWVWEAPSSGSWDLTTTDYGQIDVFSGNQLNTLRWIPGKRYGRSHLFQAIEGQQFSFRLSTHSEAELTLTLKQGASSDHIEKDTALDLGRFSHAEGRGSYYPGNRKTQSSELHSLWWRWQSPTDGVYLVEFSRDTSFQIFKEELGASLHPHNHSNLSRNQLVFDTSPGDSFLFSSTIAINANSPLEEIKISPFVRPTGDSFENRIDLGSQANVIYHGEGAGATITESDPPVHHGRHGSIWFQWVAPSSGEFQIHLEDIVPLNSEPGFGIFQGNQLSNLTLLAFAEDDDDMKAKTIVEFQKGQTYQVLIYSRDDELDLYKLTLAPLNSYHYWATEWQDHFESRWWLGRDYSGENFAPSGNISDGSVSNFERYVFGLSFYYSLRHDPSFGNLPKIIKDRDYLKIQYRLGLEASQTSSAHFSHFGEFSRNGITWEKITPIPLGDRQFEVCVPIEDEKKFLRMRAVEK